jgi:predicted ATPase
MSKVNIEGGQGDIGVGGDIVGGDKITYEAALPLALRLHQIPPPPPDFTGREQELAKLHKQFDQGITLSGVRGQGGIGKTALALKLAEALAARYPDAQLYVDLRGASDKPLTPAEALAQVVRAYHPTAKLPEEEAELRALYCSVLDGHRALLLLDAAAGAGQVAPLIPPATCGLLITSRQYFTLPGLHPLSLDTLPPADALSLMTAIVGAVGAQHAVPLQEIAKLCGYLPLALRAAASLLAETPDLSPAAYARELHNERARLALTGLKAEGAEISVEASYNLSYDRLPPETQAVFAALAVFPADFDAAAEEAVCADPGHRRLSDLVKRNILVASPS